MGLKKQQKNPLKTLSEKKTKNKKKKKVFGKTSVSSKNRNETIRTRKRCEIETYFGTGNKKTIINN